MAHRRALATGLQRLVHQVTSGSSVAQAIATSEAPVANKIAPWAVSFARSFAAQPAAAPETANTGKVTQVSRDERVGCEGGQPFVKGICQRCFGPVLIDGVRQLAIRPRSRRHRASPPSGRGHERWLQPLEAAIYVVAVARSTGSALDVHVFRPSGVGAPCSHPVFAHASSALHPAGHWCCGGRPL